MYAAAIRHSIELLRQGLRYAWFLSLRMLTTLLLMMPPALWAADKAPPSPVGVGGFLQVVLALGLVLALIAGLAYGLRRIGAVPQGGAGALRILGGLSIGQRERIVLLQVGETQLVVGVAPGAIRTLHVLETPIVMPPTAASGSGEFAQRLAAALRRGGRHV
jgi:flagellar protein FliO/FliZ